MIGWSVGQTPAACWQFWRLSATTSNLGPHRVACMAQQAAKHGPFGSAGQDFCFAAANTLRVAGVSIAGTLTVLQGGQIGGSWLSDPIYFAARLSLALVIDEVS